MSPTLYSVPVLAVLIIEFLSPASFSLSVSRFPENLNYELASCSKYNGVLYNSMQLYPFIQNYIVSYREKMVDLIM